MFKKILSYLVINFIKNHHHATLESYKKNPFLLQEKLLFKLLSTSKNTFYGKEYKFNDIKTYKDFSSQVPLCKYEDIEHLIQKIRKEEKEIFWPGKVKWFARSSGTTESKSKFIPITKACIKDHYRAGKDLFFNYMYNHPETKFLYGKTLKLGGSYQSYGSFNTFYGDLSSILIKNLPFWAEINTLPSKKTALIEKWELKLEDMIKEVLDKDVRALVGVPSWMLVFLYKLLEVSKKKYVDEIWPNMEVFFHGAVNFTPYIEQYKSLFRKQIRYYESYNASEGFFAIQDQSDSKDLLLLLDRGIFYEFIPMGDFNKSSMSPIGLQEVKLGENYALVISTNTGLWRYIIGDTIRFTSISPYRIVISGRTKHFINAFGEELIIENAEKALKKACQKTGALINEYTAGPIYMKKGAIGSHQWIIEFHKEPSDMKTFIFVLDETLKKVNSDYEAKRYNDTTLQPPIVYIARKNLFYDWMKSKGKLGGQNKVPRLSNNREYLDSLEKMDHPFKEALE